MPDELLSLLTRNEKGQRSGDTIRRRFHVGRVVAAHRSQRSLRDWERVLGGRVSRSYLHRCTVAYRLGDAFPFLLESKSVKVSHLDAVEDLPPAVQGSLLKEAETNGWTVRKLRDEARGSVQESRASRAMASVQQALASIGESLAILENQHALAREVGSARLAEVEVRLAQAHALSRFLVGVAAGAQGDESIPIGL